MIAGLPIRSPTDKSVKNSDTNTPRIPTPIPAVSSVINHLAGIGTKIGTKKSVKNSDALPRPNPARPIVTVRNQELSHAGHPYAPASHARPAFIRAAALYPDPTGTYALRTRSSSIANLARFAPPRWPLRRPSFALGSVYRYRDVPQCGRCCGAAQVCLWLCVTSIAGPNGATQLYER